MKVSAFPLAFRFLKGEKDCTRHALYISGTKNTPVCEETKKRKAKRVKNIGSLLTEKTDCDKIKCKFIKRRSLFEPRFIFLKGIKDVKKIFSLL